MTPLQVAEAAAAGAELCFPFVFIFIVDPASLFHSCADDVGDAVDFFDQFGVGMSVVLGADEAGEAAPQRVREARELQD